jgi:hypothetical protein
VYGKKPTQDSTTRLKRLFRHADVIGEKVTERLLEDLAGFRTRIFKNRFRSLHLASVPYS